MNTDTEKLCDLLYGINYQVSLFDYKHEHATDTSLAEVMKILLPHADVSECVKVAPSEAISVVQSCVDYLGSDDHGPLKEKIGSKEFADLKASLLEEIKELTAESSEIFSFYIRVGHPAYPVFWDFAFAFRRPEWTRIIIGSSSD